MLLRRLCADSDWDRPGFHKCHAKCEGLRAGKDPLRPSSALTALELASVALYFPRSRLRALSRLHLPFCCWAALPAPCNARMVSVCLTGGRWQPFFTGQERTWHGNCRMVSGLKWGLLEGSWSDLFRPETTQKTDKTLHLDQVGPHTCSGVDVVLYHSARALLNQILTAMSKESLSQNWPTETETPVRSWWYFVKSWSHLSPNAHCSHH